MTDRSSLGDGALPRCTKSGALGVSRENDLWLTCFGRAWSDDDVAEYVQIADQLIAETPWHMPVSLVYIYAGSPSLGQRRMLAEHAKRHAPSIRVALVSPSAAVRLAFSAFSRIQQWRPPHVEQRAFRPDLAREALGWLRERGEFDLDAAWRRFLDLATSCRAQEPFLRPTG